MNRIVIEALGGDPKRNFLYFHGSKIVFRLLGSRFNQWQRPILQSTKAAFKQYHVRYVHAARACPESTLPTDDQGKHKCGLQKERCM